ncbi:MULTISPECIES: signal transduction protein PmrD [unclassified Escherichia]|uniref:signal transduction protein PmrD n=2 Tax=unclassified Escherichia TaxID=2608889 RepID=UPI00102881DE|nr:MULTISPECIES: signal transduction protein PmrD [unclassified Escherichia]RZN20352.1 signal transduction protein PmrD [Escherichia sp. E14S1]TGB93999.1 signal transduction protein PmrD [Escherichia sp. E3356]
MEWLVKKSCSDKQDNRHVLKLCDTGGTIKMIAEVQTDFSVKSGDLLSPLQDALYCINREKQRTVKVISASSYSVEEWGRQCQSGCKSQ